MAPLRAVIRRASRARTRRDALVVGLRVSTGGSGVSTTGSTTGGVSLGGGATACVELWSSATVVTSALEDIALGGLDTAQAVHGHRRDRLATAQGGEFHDHRSPGHIGSRMLEQPRRRGESAPGGQHVIDDQDAAAAQIDAVSRDFQSGAAVLQVVLLGEYRRRQ